MHQAVNLDAREEARSRAQRDLQLLLLDLKQAQKCLRRDWDSLAPRDRSAQTRVVKEMEQQRRLLEDEIEMNT